jgi:hypothetical protein
MAHSAFVERTTYLSIRGASIPCRKTDPRSSDAYLLRQFWSLSFFFRPLLPPERLDCDPSFFIPLLYKCTDPIYTYHISLSPAQKKLGARSKLYSGTDTLFTRELTTYVPPCSRTGILITVLRNAARPVTHLARCLVPDLMKRA